MASPDALLNVPRDWTCLVLAGPTASGKTAISLALAQRWPIEIISVDSALVYRGMDIGTAKPSAEERAAVPHHLLDIRDPAQAYNAADFARDAQDLMLAIRQRGKLPVLVGGTLLYFKALFDGLDDLPKADPAIRAAIEAQADSLGWPALHAQLASIDPTTAARLAPRDAQRIGRALEVWQLTGRPLSSFFGQGSKSLSAPERPLWLSLEPNDRAWLHQRIAQRFDIMLAQGFLDEVRQLRARGDLHPELPAMRCVGYRQAWHLLDQFPQGPVPTDSPAYLQFREQGIAATRQLAKRQLTWLRSLPQRNNSSRILKVHVLPQGDTFEVDASDTLLKGAERAGWRWPSSCRNGTCRACLCRLQAGEIRYTLEWPGVSAEEKAQGWILPCVAQALSDVTIEQPAAHKLPPALPMLWSDDDLLVLNKPSGLLAVPGKGPDKQDCLSRRVTDLYPEALVVHRLDQGTSGLLLMARNAEAQKKLGHAFEHRQVDKLYLARVHGVLPESLDWQTIDLPILLDWPQRPRHIIDASGRSSQTHWRCLQSDPQNQSSLLLLRPLTGRTHQLRVHLQAIGHPIWGDALYAPDAVQARSNRLMLHAWRLSLPHPRLGTPLRLAAPPPPGLSPGSVSVV